MIKIKDLSKNEKPLFCYSNEKYKIKNKLTGEVYDFVIHDNKNEVYEVTDVIKIGFVSNNAK